MSDRDNNGILGRNKRRQTDAHPEFTGSAKVAGIEYWLSGYVKTSSKDGSKFFSLWFKAKEEKRAPQAKPSPMDDDVPF